MTIFGRPKDCPLFEGVAPEELDGVLHCLGARDASFTKGEFILLEGSPSAMWACCYPGECSCSARTSTATAAS